MPSIGPIKRKDLIYYLRRLGFEGPFMLFIIYVTSINTSLTNTRTIPS